MELEPLSRRQWLFLLLLAGIQFLHIIDFIILMPLATYLEASLGTTTKSFGLIVSAYGIAAALSGVAFAPLLDKFDRKRTLLFVFAGFTIGTAGCAAAPNFWFLAAARFVTGAFGGVVGSSVLAIVGDAFPASRRATAMGAVMSAFSVASIVGLPAGLYLAQGSVHGWRAPFGVLAVLGVLLLVLSAWTMPSVRGHLDQQQSSMAQVLSRSPHLRAFAFTLILLMSSSMMFPFLAAFLEKNVGMTKAQIPLMYLYGGLATLFTMNLFGRLADRFSRLAVFRVLGFLCLFPMVGVTLLPEESPLALKLTVTTAMMILVSGRGVPAFAMIASSAEPRERGRFLSINAAVQQSALGLAPLLAGLMMSERDGKLVDFTLVSVVGAGFGLASIYLAGGLRMPDIVPDAEPMLAQETLQETV